LNGICDSGGIFCQLKTTRLAETSKMADVVMEERGNDGTTAAVWKSWFDFAMLAL
jgi:hypothetical protein